MRDDHPPTKYAILNTPSGAPGVLYATGHYRHGILLTPITAQEIARLVQTSTVSEWLEPVLPSRFADSEIANAAY